MSLQPNLAARHGSATVCARRTNNLSRLTINQRGFRGRSAQGMQQLNLAVDALQILKRGRTCQIQPHHYVICALEIFSELVRRVSARWAQGLEFDTQPTHDRFNCKPTFH